jgi:uncharacterized membrane protein YfcA
VPPLEATLLVVVGVAVGAYATAIGAGGGFLITPLLLLRYEAALPVEVTTASLTVVAISAAASSLLAAIGRRIDYGVTAFLAASRSESRPSCLHSPGTCCGGRARSS